jgi:hypothetical protein
MTALELRKRQVFDKTLICHLNLSTPSLDFMSHMRMVPHALEMATIVVASAL